jgi:hypothetical protein
MSKHKPSICWLNKVHVLLIIMDFTYFGGHIPKRKLDFSTSTRYLEYLAFRTMPTKDFIYGCGDLEIPWK